MANKGFVVFKREYLERVRSKWFIFATILGPVLMGALTILPAVMAAKTRTSTQLTNIIVIDATGVDLGKRVAQSLGTARGNPLAPADAGEAPVPQVHVVKADAIDA